MSLERLVFEHDAIDLLSRNLRELTTQEPPEFDAAISLLAQLAHEVEAHLDYEDRSVYSVLIERYKKPPLIGADTFEQLFQALRIDWCGYLAEWCEENVRSEWGRFCAATAAIIPRLQARVRTENNLIYSRALNDGVITLREAS
jgi:hypothetical protein